MSKKTNTSFSELSCNTVADLILQYLENIGVDYIFGVPGGAIEPFYNAAARSSRRGGPRIIGARHETDAAYMADGYQRETGKLGVCVATSGPGATNMITGVACAYDNHVPLLVITGQPAIHSFGRGALQESSCTGIDIIGMMEHCTRYNSLVSHPDQVVPKLTNAIAAAKRFPAGPSHLSFPVDIMRSELNEKPVFYDLSRHLSAQNNSCDETAILECFELLNNKNQPLFFIGRDAEGAINNIMRLVEICNALFITTPDAKGLIDVRHKSFRGVFGLGGHASAMLLLQHHKSYIFAFGAGFGEFSSATWSPALMNDRLVHIDQNPEHLAQTPMSALHVEGNIYHTSQRLIEHFSHRKSEVRIETGFYKDINPAVILDSVNEFFSEEKPIKPQRLMKELSERFPAKTRFVADAGNSMMWAPHYLQPDTRNANRKGDSVLPYKTLYRRPENWLRMALNFAPMGWAIGASIGMARADTRSPVVCITGDGAYLMCGQEITVAVQEQLPVIFVILNDSVYGMVMHGQRLSGGEQFGFQLPAVDFSQQAEAIGVESLIIESPEDFDKLPENCFRQRRAPMILDVRIDREQVPPMTMRLQALGSIEKKKITT